MTTWQSRRTDRTDRDDPRRRAADARSILSCPSGVDLVVDGCPSVLEDGEDLGMQDLEGVPTFTCRPLAPLARAACAGRAALITLSSGLGPRGATERGDSLALAGRLVRERREDCDCCAEPREVISLETDFVVLTRRLPGRGTPAPGHQVRVPLAEFRSADHHLNRGYLQRSVEHANDCHQDELRRAVSTTTGTRLGEVLGVRLTGLSEHGVEIDWVDPLGAHRTALAFERPARTTEELGDLLRRELHAGLC